MIAPIINNVPPKKVLSVIPPIMGPAKNITNPIVDTGLLKKEPFTVPKSSLPNSPSPWMNSLSTAKGAFVPLLQQNDNTEHICTQSNGLIKCPNALHGFVSPPQFAVFGLA